VTALTATSTSAVAAPTRARQVARLVAGARVVLGVVALLRPSIPARPWIGSDARRPSLAVFGRALGGRDVALGAVALAATTDGELRRAALAGALADACDGIATVASFTSLPRRLRYGVLLLTFGAAAIGGVAGALVADGDAAR
jgi:hypothetical protein